jgi:hypothetical protein
MPGTVRKGFRLILKNWFFWLPYLTAVFGGANYLRNLYYFEPPANVGLDFRGAAPIYMRPDLGLHEDLKKIGIDNPRTDVTGVSQFEVFSGIIRNKGTRDAEELEMKVPTHGNLLFYKAAGLLDGEAPEPDYDKIKMLAHGNGAVSPFDYVKLTPMRVDDPPLFFMLWCQLGSVTEVTFRYREGDATKTERYVRKTDEQGFIYFNRIIKWDMDAWDLKRFAKRAGMWLAIGATGVLVGFWKRRWLWRKTKGLFRGLWIEFRSFLARMKRHMSAESGGAPSGGDGNILPTAPWSQAVPKLTKKQIEQQERAERRRRRNEQKRKNKWRYR